MTENNKERKRLSIEMRREQRDKYLSYFAHTAVEAKDALNQKDCGKAIERLMPPQSVRHYNDKSGVVFDYFTMDAYKYCFGIWALPPTLPQLHQMRDFIGNGLCLEIGAGRGAHSALLRAAGCRVIATDSNPALGVNITVQPGMDNFVYGEVQAMTASEALRHYGAEADVLLVVWSLKSPTAAALRHFKGTKAIVIGERDGCTNAGALQKYCDYQVSDTADEWQQVEEWEHPHWDACYDVCILLKRRQK